MNYEGQKRIPAPSVKLEMIYSRMPMVSHDFMCWATIMSNVLRLAFQDHLQAKKRRSGKELTHLFTISSRRRHDRALSGVYNQFRDELDTPVTK